MCTTSSTRRWPMPSMGKTSGYAAGLQQAPAPQIYVK